MTIEEYTSIKEDNPNRDDFTYWLEHKLSSIGRVRGHAGGLGNLKFCICRCNSNDLNVKKEFKYSSDRQYAWLVDCAENANNEKEAFEVIKSKIINIIKASQNNDLEAIEKINFYDMIKWKIAFHYQNQEKMKIIGIFSKKILEKIFLDKFGERLKTYQQFYQRLLGSEKPLAEVIRIADDLSSEYNKKKNNTKNEYDKEQSMMSNKTNKTISPLNQILYGPPGTGKTYHTIDKALEILGENLENRIDKKAKFDEYVKNGQIVFTTFHQSYGYEEFVESIKPDIRKDDEDLQELKYEIKDGVFKELCKKALENEDNIKDFNVYIDKLKEKAKEEDNNPEKYFKLPNTKYSIQYRGGKTFRIKFDDMSKNHKDYPVNIDNIMKLYKTSSVNEIYNSAYVKAILNYLKLQGLKDYQDKPKETNLPYIIIIDEINRGNVSKIFGELITLIEPSKRIGAEEELRVTLPYSGEKFGVPENVYIIGTMNTADRSITSLDTALRRRFEFVEMMPNPKELENLEYKDVDLSKLLTAINTRIECLLDREKTIGHAFFIGIKNLENLKSVFQNKIIPLLQEYFYDDYASINAVLNDNRMVEKAENKENDYLNSIKKLETYNEKTIYNINSFDNEIWDKIETYQKIYIDNKTEENNKNND
ncbi:AAA family ATPase [Campylobacter sp. 2018MI35]|nr:AAA family ATPase [Campylobacter sp. 2018MI35]